MSERPRRAGMPGSKLARYGRPAGWLMVARPWHLGVGAVAVGLAIAGSGSAAHHPAVLIVAVPAAAFLIAASALGRRPALGALAAVGLLVGGAVGDARLEAIDRASSLIGNEREVDLTAHLLTRPMASPLGASAEARVSEGRLRGARLLVRIPLWSGLPPRAGPGHELRLEGRIRPIGGAAPSADFDFAAHLRRRGIAGELLLDRARLTGRRRGGLAGVLDRMRERAERAVAAGMPPREAELARGMVLGQDERIDAVTRDDFRDSGLAHLLAVSGQNVMLLVALALPLLALLGLGPRARGAALLALVAIYVPLAGAGPSLQRAGVMGAAGIAALTLSRPASRWYALLLAAVVTLTLDPRAWQEPGWQLSFAAVTGILTIGRPLARALSKAGEALLPPASLPPAPSRRVTATRALMRGFAEGLAITIAATVATAPLLAHHFGSVPIAGLPANLLALPAVAPAMWLGMVKAALGLVSPLLPPATPLAELAGALARLPVAYIAALAERFADLPAGQMPVALRSPLGVVLAYGVIAVATVAARTAAGRAATRAQQLAGAWRRAPRSRRTAAIAALVALAALMTARTLATPAPPDALTVRFLDVGQGDATLIQHPDGSAVLFDGGPPEGGVERLLRRAGVRRLSLVVATHASRDHHGGLADVLSRRSVELLLDGGDGSPDPGFRSLRTTAARRGIPVLPVGAPATLRAGSLTIRILSPAPRPPGPAPEDPNPRAIVAIVSSGEFDLLLSADAESETLLPLDLPDVEAMKVPHHGSADHGLPAVLQRLRPEIAAIEVGPNAYGHPTPSTLAALRHANVTTYRTDRDGTVTLTVENGAMRVATER